MPRYREERELIRDVPGAFGQIDDRAFRLRPDADFLDGTGRYKHCLRILLDEEYGYRTWLWTYPGSVKELVEDWKAGRRPVCNTARWDHRPHVWRGEVDEIDWRRAPFDVDEPSSEMSSDMYNEHPILVKTQQPIMCLSGFDSFDGEGHVHEEDDSYLKIGGYELYGLKEVTVIIHVLDILASL